MAVILLVEVIQMVNWDIDFLNPIEKALSDVHISDLVFSTFKEKEMPHPDVVLVNFGDLSRAQIAQEINIINQYEPAAIGIDAFFMSEKGPVNDFPLMMAIKNTKNMVLVSDVALDSLNVKEGKYEYLRTSNPMFQQYAEHGFANFITGGEEGYRTTRNFTPKELVADTIEWNFTSRLLQLARPALFDSTLKQRQKQLEVINYYGNYNSFLRLDINQVFDPNVDKSFLKDKIVLMGYMGSSFGKRDLTDVFYTPLNPEYAGRSYPDMYGIVVHANILSMMLKNDYFEQAPNWINYLVAIVLCILNINLFLFLSVTIPASFQLIMRLAQVLQLIVFTGVSLYLLSELDYKWDSTPTLALILICGDITDIYSDSGRPLVNKRVVKLEKKYPALKRGLIAAIVSRRKQLKEAA